MRDTCGAIVEAVSCWAMQEAWPRDRRGSTPDGPTLFDLANPLELGVEPITATIEPSSMTSGQIGIICPPA
jgi:hypothetical protein